MKHLFENNDGEIVAADTAEQATQYHDVELAGETPDPEDWTQLDDDAAVPITGVDDADPEKAVTKRAVEWAAEHETPTLVSSTYA